MADPGAFTKDNNQLLESFLQVQEVLFEVYNRTQAEDLEPTSGSGFDYSDSNESSPSCRDDKSDRGAEPDNTENASDRNETVQESDLDEDEDSNYPAAPAEEEELESSDEFEYADYCQQEDATRTSRIWRRARDLTRGTPSPSRYTADTRRRRTRRLQHLLELRSWRQVVFEPRETLGQHGNHNYPDEDADEGSWRAISTNCRQTPRQAGTSAVATEADVGASSIIHANRFACLRSERL